MNGQKTTISIAILIAIASMGTAFCSEGGRDSQPEAMKAELAKHRNLFNGDFGIFFWNAETWQPEGGPYSAKAIHRFVKNLADNGVDTFVINPNSQVAWYPSRAIPTVVDDYVRDDPTVGNGNWWCHDLLNPALDLKEAGVDSLAETIKACRRYGISPWVSIRMNDPHLNHPYLQSPLYKDPKHRLGGGLNYEHREVRDYYFALIRELVEDYGFDGLELDWLRCPNCCRAPASPQTVDVMTSWLSQIRRLVDTKAKQTGRPFPLGMRTPGNYKQMRTIGIDVEGVIRSGMLDFICPTNFMQTTWAMPHDQLREQFGRYVAIYGVTELWINELLVHSGELDRNIAPYNCASPPAARGNAAGKLVLGADGIQQYNFFVADLSRKYDKVPGLRSRYDALRNLHDLDWLRGRAKHYSICSDLRNFGPREFDLPKPLPATLEPGGPRAFRLPMCAEPTDRGLALTVQIVVEKKDVAPKISVGFGRSDPTFDCKATNRLLFPMGPALHHLPKYQAYDYRFDVNRINDGWNEIVLTNSGSDPARIVSLELAVAPEGTDKATKSTNRQVPGHQDPQ